MRYISSNVAHNSSPNTYILVYLVSDYADSGDMGTLPILEEYIWKVSYDFKDVPKRNVYLVKPTAFMFDDIKY